MWLIFRGYRSKAPGHICEAVVCLVILWQLQVPKVLLQLGRGCLVSVALPAVYSCREGQGPAGACWRPGRWSSLQHFSCLGPGSSLTVKLEHADPEHCDLLAQFPPTPSPAAQAGRREPSSLPLDFPCLEDSFFFLFLNPETERRERWGELEGAALQASGESDWIPPDLELACEVFSPQAPAPALLSACLDRGQIKEWGHLLPGSPCHPASQRSSS